MRLAVQGKFDAVICLGCVIRGETPHFDYIAAEVSKGIGQIALQTDTPVAFGVSDDRHARTGARTCRRQGGEQRVGRSSLCDRAGGPEGTTLRREERLEALTGAGGDGPRVRRPLCQCTGYEDARVAHPCPLPPWFPALYGGAGVWENFTSMKDVKGVAGSGHTLLGRDERGIVPLGRGDRYLPQAHERRRASRARTSPPSRSTGTATCGAAHPRA